MRKKLLSSLTLTMLLSFSNSFSQVTLLSNNTNLTTGLVINGKGLLISENDSLWVTDGTPGGTVKLVNTVRYSDTGLAVYKGKLYFTGVDAANGYELWMTDATAGGTSLVKNINPGAASSFAQDYHIFNNTLFFAANDGTSGMELWSSDGTTGGTNLFKDINPGAAGSLNNPRFFEVSGVLYFVANDGTNGEELWKTDGTPGGTTMVANITTGAASTSFLEFSKIGSTLIFAIAKGTFPLATQELWKSDGTSGGTSAIKTFGTASGFFPPFFYPFNSKLYFIGTENPTGSELWTTDGTSAGTSIVKDIFVGDGSGFPFTFNAITINNKFYFGATNEAAGTELWVSDGTNAGTVLLKDINPGPGDSDPLIYKHYDPYVSEGFLGNTLYNGKIFMEADNGTNGTELWSTDGTAAGTVMVKDIFPGVGSGIDSVLSYAYTTTGMYFSATNGTQGFEPWVTNGTDAGTTQVFDINNGTGGSDPQYIFFYNSQLYFNANNGDNTVINTDLYKLNGTLQPLPVSMLNFSLTKQPANAVRVDWTIANQQNTSYFIVERSIDGVAYTEAGRVNAMQISNNRQGYTYMDVEAGKLNKTTLYYRLKMVDKDGSFKHTGILQVKFGDTNFQFSFAPNPVQKQMTVTVASGGAKSISLRITDASGRLVYVQNLPTAQTTLQQSINVERLQKGSYFIQVISDNTVQSKRFIKQ